MNGVGGTRGGNGKVGNIAGIGVTALGVPVPAPAVGVIAGEATFPAAECVLTSLARRGIFAGDAVGVGRSDLASFLQRSFSFSLSLSLLLSLSRLDFSLSLLDDFLSFSSTVTAVAAALVNLYLCSNTILRISILESSLFGRFLGVLLLLLLLLLLVLVLLLLLFVLLLVC